MARPKNLAIDDGVADYLNGAQCANRLGVSMDTWNRWTRNGTAPGGTKLSRGTVRWARAEFEEWLRNRPPAGTAMGAKHAEDAA